MFDTMTLTKLIGAFCGSLLIFMLGNWAAELLYNTDTGGHGDHAQQAYVIDTADVGGAAAAGAVEETVDFAALVAEGDAEKGAKVFSKCKACHKLEDGANATGPHLYGVVGRPVASVDGFGYSGAMSELGGAWTPEHLNEFLTKPKDLVPGTKMSFAGLKKIADRANLVAYLATIGG